MQGLIQGGGRGANAPPRISVAPPKHMTPSTIPLLPCQMCPPPPPPPPPQFLLLRSQGLMSRLNPGMCSEGTVVVLSLSVCLCSKLACSTFIGSINDTTYLTHNQGVKFCGIFSETAPLQSQSPSNIVRLLRESATTDKCMSLP